MNYHNITTVDMVNGKGLRTVLWLSGCSHACPGCHNEKTWNPQSGIQFDLKAKQELLGYLQEDYISGLTLSGGDPLYEGNRQEVLELVKEIQERFPKKTIWVYTGHKFEEINHLEILNYVDVLVDGRFEIQQLSQKYPWAGSENQRIIDVKKTLKEGRIVTYANY